MKNRAGFDWGELIVGLLLTALGVFMFIQPGNILTGAIVVYGIIIIAMGAYDIVIYARISRFTGFGPMLSLIAGIFSVMCGIMLVANPNIGKWALTVLMPIWFIAHSISGLTRANIVKLFGNTFYYGFYMTLNILGLILGFFMIFSQAFSLFTLRVAGYIAGAYLVLFGIESIISAFVRRNSDM